MWIVSWKFQKTFPNSFSKEHYWTRFWWLQYRNKLLRYHKSYCRTKTCSTIQILLHILLSITLNHFPKSQIYTSYWLFYLLQQFLGKLTKEIQSSKTDCPVILITTKKTGYTDQNDKSYIWVSPYMTVIKTFSEAIRSGDNKIEPNVFRYVMVWNKVMNGCRSTAKKY